MELLVFDVPEDTPDENNQLAFTVDAKPVQQGSLNRSASGHTYHSNGKALKAYRKKVREAAEVVFADRPVHEGPVHMEVWFHFERPKTGDGANPEKRPYPTVTPDTDKLQRAIGDALEGLVYDDDKRIIGWSAYKRYAPCGMGASAHVAVTLIDKNHPALRSPLERTDEGEAA